MSRQETAKSKRTPEQLKSEYEEFFGAAARGNQVLVHGNFKQVSFYKPQKVVYSSSTVGR